MEHGIGIDPEQLNIPPKITETKTNIDEEVAKFSNSYDEMNESEQEQLKKEMIGFLQARGKDTTPLSSANQIIDAYIRLKNEIRPGL